MWQVAGRGAGGLYIPDPNPPELKYLVANARLLEVFDAVGFPAYQFAVEDQETPGKQPTFGFLSVFTPK